MYNKKVSISHFRLEYLYKIIFFVWNLRKLQKSFRRSNSQIQIADQTQNPNEVELNNCDRQIDSEYLRIPVIEDISAPSDFDLFMDETRLELGKCKWYWPGLSRTSAQQKLRDQKNGSFLVRDSQTVNQFTLSFRSSGFTLHVRIDYKDNHW